MTDKTEAQPEALRLADRLIGNAQIDECEGCNPVVVALERSAAAELRRQHAEIQQLKAQLSARQAAPLCYLHVAATIFPDSGYQVCSSADAGAFPVYAAAPPPPEREPRCWCETCQPITLSNMRMVLCPDCGNKRCPKATHHDNACTNSNAPGQPGSSWAHVKPHGATNDNP